MGRGSLPSSAGKGSVDSSAEKGTAPSYKGASERLIETLLSKELIQQKDLDRALAMQRERGGSLVQLLLQLGCVESKALASCLSNTLGIPLISLSRMALDSNLTQLVPRRLAFQYNVIPISRLGSQLSIAMLDPMNLIVTDHLSQTTGLNLTLFISTAEEIQEALRRLYGGTMAETLEELKGKAEGTVEFLSEGGPEPQKPVEDLLRLTQQGPVVRLTHAILQEGVGLKASDILVEPFETRLRIRYRVDGVFREGNPLPVAMHSGIVSRLKVLSNLNIAEHRLPQDGRICFLTEGRAVDLRISVIPSYFGEKVCLRILDKTQAVLDIERLGLDPEPLEALKQAARSPHGMILITGPTGSGKTTTLYALLRRVDRPELNLVTVEDPVEFDLPGINQVNVHPEIGLTFAAGLRSILRQDPNVILVGEIRDEETADIAVKAALTGHLVLSTLHANDAIGAVARLANMGVEPYLIAASVLLVGAQRLPRKVCASCSLPLTPSPELIRQLSLPPKGNYKKGKGCPECRATGLDGRVGLLEAVPLTPDLRRLVSQEASSVKLHEAAREAGFLNLRELAVRKAAQGVIPLEEVARTTMGFEES